MVSYFKQCAADFIYNSCKLEDQQQDHIALNLSYRDIGMCNVTSRTYMLMEMDFRMINLVFDISVLYTTQICKVKETKTSTKKGLQMPSVMSILIFVPSPLFNASSSLPIYFPRGTCCALANNAPNKISFVELVANIFQIY